MSRSRTVFLSTVAALFVAAACTEPESTGPGQETGTPSFSHTISCDFTVTETGAQTIQDAVDAASAGDNICVEAGTYTENVDIDKAVNVIGAGAGVTTLESANSSSEFLVRISDGNSLVTLSQGMELSGFTFKGPLSGDRDLVMFRATVNDPNDPIVVRDNVFDCDASDDRIVGLESAAVGDMENAVIEDNSFINRCRFAMFLNSAINWTIQNNTVQDSRFGGFVMNTSDPGRLHDIDVLDNTFTSGVEDGGSFLPNQFVAEIGLSSVMFNVEVSGNTIEGSSGHSITVGDRGNTVLTGMNIQCNNILTSAGGALNQLPANVIPAENNWWDAADGPSGVGPGSGEAVSDGFDFDPFLTAPVSDPCPPPAVIQVDIDIKPGSDPNSVNPKSRGVLPVAILTTPDFDAATVDPSTVTLGDDDGDDTPVAQKPNGSLFARLEDVDGDADLDLSLKFRTQALVANGDLDGSTTELILNGETFGGDDIQGSDSVNPVGN